MKAISDKENKQSGPMDADQVDVKEEEEVEFWIDKFAISIRQVAVQVNRIESRLSRLAMK